MHLYCTDVTGWSDQQIYDALEMTTKGGKAGINRESNGRLILWSAGMSESDYKAIIKHWLIDNIRPFVGLKKEALPGLLLSENGCAGIDETLLTPDLSVFLMDRMKTPQERKEMKTASKLPNVVIEIEWESKIAQDKLGENKILNYYFSNSYVGADGRPVLEAWLVCWPDEIEPFEELPEQYYHADVHRPAAPYIGFYIRDAQTSFVPVRKNGRVHIPPNSLLRHVPPMRVNDLLDMLFFGS